MIIANLFFNSIKIAPYIITESTTEKMVFIIKDWKLKLHNIQTKIIPMHPIIEETNVCSNVFDVKTSLTKSLA